MRYIIPYIMRLIIKSNTRVGSTECQKTPACALLPQDTEFSVCTFTALRMAFTTTLGLLAIGPL